MSEVIVETVTQRVVQVRNSPGPQGPQGTPGGAADGDVAIALSTGPLTQSALAGEINDPASAPRLALDDLYANLRIRSLLDSAALRNLPGKLAPRPELGLSFDVPIERSALGIYTSTLEPSSRHTPAASGPTYYVNKATGSNTNDGLTPATAFKDPAYASLKNSSDAAQILIYAGVYTRAESLGIRRKNITIKAVAGQRVVMTACDVIASWTLVSGTTYSATLATCNGVLDNGIVDADLNPTELEQKTSVLEVQGSPGSWYITGGVLYVNLTDGRAPDGNVLASRPVNTLAYAGITGADVSTYLEGIEWWGGTTANLTAVGDGNRLYAKGCKWKYAGSTNGLSTLGLSEIILKDCEASFNYLDGFNYHEDTSGRQSTIVEIGCSGRGNGKTPGSQNGSTAHEASKILRVGCVYFDNGGSNIADVNATISHNVGTAAYGAGDGVDFYSGGSWNEECSSGSATAFKTDPTATGGGTVRIKACSFSGSLSATTGTIVEF